MLLLPDAWTWDLWLVDDGDRFHAFFLKASRALLDPERRHRRASLGHAVSDDLRDWTVLPDALVHADSPAFDDLAIWTGCVVKNPAGGWRLFYTGISRGDDGDVQRIGSADSADLLTWQRSDAPTALEADPRWYAKRGAVVPHEDWRDPWVYPDPSGSGWHMLVTAVAAGGTERDAGVVGHATSPDLYEWTVQPPLSAPGTGFGQYEVMQVAVVDDRPVLVFSCFATELDDDRRAAGQAGGMWAVAADSVLGPFDPSHAQPLTGPDFYAGRVIQDRDGGWVLLAFRAADDSGDFVGGISDPIPVAWTPSNAPGQPFRLASSSSRT